MPENAESVSLFAWLLACGTMAITLALSALFSASEAALFSLTPQHRQKLGIGRTVETIDALLSNPSQLLSCILLCNLAVNITFFSCSNVIVNWISLRPGYDSVAYIFGATSLVLLILVSELLPKCIGVLAPIRISRLVAFPLWWVTKATSYLAKTMHHVSDICRRLIWPGLRPESVLDTSDLERAIELSETDSQLRDLEKSVLQNILQLSNIEAHEWMHPKSQFAFAQLPLDGPTISRCIDEIRANGEDSPGQLLLITSSQDNEIIATSSLEELLTSSKGSIPPKTHSVLFFPWCATLSTIFQQFLVTEKRHGIVVNERGESIGVILIDDLIEATFATIQRGTNPLGNIQFTQTGETQWTIDGKTRIKRLEKAINRKLPDSRDATIAGVIQSQLRRLAHVGDRVLWGDYVLDVTDIPRRGEMIVRLTTSDIEMPEIAVEDSE